MTKRKVEGGSVDYNMLFKILVFLSLEVPEVEGGNFFMEDVSTLPQNSLKPLQDLFEATL